METTSDAIPQRLVAALEGKYRIEREIGAGGSATVFLAEDLKHHRRVAIKVLNPQVAAALGPERFEDEVRIAAGLHHPHILTVHDSGEAAGLLYYVMPYVDGQSLRDRMAEGLLPFPKVAKLLAEVADALAYAHAQGIVHRDIKPENILYNGKHVVVTDFGIAKAISDAAERKSSTSLGIALGTPAYMAPEQASSDPSLDHRADLYSLGIVGYELLAGHPPFSGSAQQILTSHLTTKPEPIANLRQGIPPALASAVMRALAKSPAERWPNAEAMQSQLETITGTTSNSGLMATVALAASRRSPARTLVAGAVGVAVLAAVGVMGWKRMQPAAAAPAAVAAQAASTQPGAPAGIPEIATDPSIAVLPFENMSSDKEQAYFSDGIAEELLNLLSKVPELRVTARTSSFQFRGQDVGIQEIARKLNVAAVLQGSVRKSGDTVRITAQLIRAKDGVQLWSETYDRRLDDVFKVQDEIAATVVDKLKLTLLGEAPKLRLANPAVYPLLIQADALASRNTRGSRAEAIARYQEVLAQSPNEARAWAGLARCYLNQRNQLERPAAEANPLIEQAARKAIALDPQLATPHTYLGQLALSRRDIQAAAAHYQHALDLAPNQLAVLSNSAALLSRLGRVNDVLAIRRFGARVDPANPQAHANLCVGELLAGNLAPSEAACRVALILSPDTPFLRAAMAQAQMMQGKLDQARRTAKDEPDESSRLTVESQVEFMAGNRAVADAKLHELEAKYATVYPMGVVEIHALRKDADAAFAWLERARKAEDPELMGIHTNPLLDNLHADPRWSPLLRELGLAPEALAKVKFEVKLPQTVVR